MDYFNAWVGGLICALVQILPVKPNLCLDVSWFFWYAQLYSWRHRHLSASD